MKRAIQWTRKERIAGWSVLAGVFVLAFFTLWASFAETSVPRELAAGSDIVLPLAKIKTGKLFLFRYHIDSSATAPVAVLRGPDGMIHATFAACRPCFKSGSYERSGKHMCGHCRHVMNVKDPKDQIPPAKSACMLLSLEYAVEGNILLVRAATIQSEFSRQFGIQQ